MKYYEHLQLLKSIKGVGLATINARFLDVIPQYEGFDDFADYLAENYDQVNTQSIKREVESTLEKIDRDPSVKVITCFDDEYPACFKKLGNQKPVLFYAKGDTSLLSSETIAVIGTRKPSIYGISATKKIISKMTESTIVSGLALGIDAEAHKAALATDLKTLAVLPNGLYNITPASNRELADKILNAGGCLITEYELNEGVERYKYLRRDSLVAAISKGIVVIECGEESGTMYTVESALKMKKPISCYYTDRGGDYSGNKKLIDSGKAERLLNPEDINNLIEKTGKVADNDSYQTSIFDIGVVK